MTRPKEAKAAREADKAVRDWNPPSKGVRKKVNADEQLNKLWMKLMTKVVDKLKDWIAATQSNGQMHAPKVRRAFVDESALGLPDRALMRDVHTNRQFWTQMIDNVAVKPFFGAEGALKVVQALVRTRPFEKPSDGALYREVRAKLRTILDLGKTTGWTTTTTLRRIEFPTEEELEALRIYGDADGGMGVMPNVIAQMLRDAGLTWMCQDPEDRELSTFWLVFLTRPAMKNTTAWVSLATSRERTALPTRPDTEMLAFLDKDSEGPAAETRAVGNENLVEHENPAAKPSKKPEDPITGQYEESSSEDDDGIPARKTTAVQKEGQKGSASNSVSDRQRDDANNDATMAQDESPDKNDRKTLVEMLGDVLRRDGPVELSREEAARWITVICPGLSRRLGETVFVDDDDALAALVSQLDERWVGIMKESTYDLAGQLVGAVAALAQRNREQAIVAERAERRIDELEDRLDESERKRKALEDRLDGDRKATDDRLERLERQLTQVKEAREVGPTARVARPPILLQTRPRDEVTFAMPFKARPMGAESPKTPSSTTESQASAERKTSTRGKEKATLEDLYPDEQEEKREGSRRTKRRKTSG